MQGRRSAQAVAQPATLGPRLRSPRRSWKGFPTNVLPSHRTPQRARLAAHESRTKRCAAVLQRPPISEPRGQELLRAAPRLAAPQPAARHRPPPRRMDVVPFVLGGNQCRVAAQRSSVGAGPVNDEIMATAVVGRVGEPLLWHDLTFGSDGLSHHVGPRAIDDSSTPGQQGKRGHGRRKGR